MLYYGRLWPAFWGAGGFWDLGFKISPISDHVTKFHGGRPRELGDFAMKVAER